ncbi:hypothetical protein BTO20_00410 [Mycobacterium dioxanotrophicus]|uniref:Uncharacterized protein n=1 Tax=Mycobacterium dioxanotrophicus TaxID=482462 RepID=A0A1Y0BWK6_9MYCO|nr:Gfo/Idh/MocA family oxidoreductase [Mycobacterium dioxanotrophicus]ART67286.1 hypothetical protein BTO20_00410 [Mycobacterium dioxanotrophicus]
MNAQHLRPLRLGLLGASRVNARIVAAATRLPDLVQIVALASRDGDRARSEAARFSIPRSYGSYEGLLDADDIDAVYIGLPNSLHLPWAQQSILRSKHVLVEKPLSRNPEEVMRTFQMAEKADVRVFEGLMFRYHQNTVRVLEVLQDGRLGRLKLIQAHFSFPLDRPSDVRLSSELDGGAVMDLGCYCIAASRLFAGEPRSIFGTGVLTDSGVDRRASVTLVTADDVITRFDVDMTLQRHQYLVAHCEEGRVEMLSPFHCAGGVYLTNSQGQRSVLSMDDTNPFDCELGAFIDEIANPLGAGRAQDAIDQATVLQRVVAAVHQ